MADNQTTQRPWGDLATGDHGKSGSPFQFKVGDAHGHSVVLVPTRTGMSFLKDARSDQEQRLDRSVGWTSGPDFH
ncbi:hypothetical protein HLH34_00030 [Gluconacetobacter azotocaptans]|uniref:Uncharacterized protein n=1 Tax=Gluconacetobacter azotocaptans TaxID=142834 RepID=A0A7W4JP40_9PROT|nr:hypothetical protein [Gluconacetobacter azotocaptans]MBB2188359.1 hypothetical protein [Gluconacetobacter azotocaptans]GBQ32019.1 hypothetical protein AA13594_2250 [Gluconacetobacter azotocaptans DSM 13594]